MHVSRCFKGAAYLTSECDIFLLLKPAQIYPKGLRAESARAVAGRRCPHSGEGEDFLSSQLNFFTKTAVTPSLFVCFQPVVLAGEFSNQNSTEGLFVCNPVRFGQGYTTLLLYSII